MKTIPEQIKELQEHLNHFEAEKFGLFEKIRVIRAREKEGRIYGDEAQQVANCNIRIQQLITDISRKEREVARLEKQQLGSTQKAFF